MDECRHSLIVVVLTRHVSKPTALNNTTFPHHWPQQQEASTRNAKESNLYKVIIQQKFSDCQKLLSLSVYHMRELQHRKWQKKPSGVETLPGLLVCLILDLSMLLLSAAHPTCQFVLNPFHTAAFWANVVGNGVLCGKMFWREEVDEV